MKSNRQEMILEIIANQEIETQGQLQEALAACGIKSTQATLSRDIKDLHLSKKLNENNKAVYVRDEHYSDNTDVIGRLLKIFRESVKSYDIAQNIIVVKTLPGLASAACSAIDSMPVMNLAGTLAGDDTAFLLFKDFSSAEMFLEEIQSLE